MSRYIPDKVKKFVGERAHFQCEYCQTHQRDSFLPFQIDHIISLKHGGTSEIQNLALSCFPCNNEKGSDIGTILPDFEHFSRIYNPRKDIWRNHFDVFEHVFYSKTEIGAATLKLLKLNDLDRIIERKAVSEEI
jgi:HNH endonuclease